jgi:hypothetical protein
MIDTKPRGKNSLGGSVKSSKPVTAKMIADVITKRCEKAGLSEQSIRMIVSAATDAHTVNQYFADETALRAATEWLVSLEQGNSRDMRGAYFILDRDSKGRPSKWMDYKDIIALADTYFGEETGDDAWERVYHLNEESNRKKIGPKGLFLPASKDLKPKIEAIWSPKEFSGSKAALESTFSRLEELLPPNSVDLISIDRAATSLPEGSLYIEDQIKSLDPTTNSGPPWYKRKWSPYGYRDTSSSAYRRSAMVFEYIVELSKSSLVDLKAGKVIHLRSMAHQRLTQRGLDQLSDSKSKRLVVAMEKRDAVLGKTIMANLIPAIRKVRPFSGTAHTFCALMDAPAVDISVQTMMSENGSEPILSTDFAGFDQTMIPSIMMRIAEVMSKWVRGGEWIVPFMESVIYHTSILSPVGFWNEMESSTKSGSWSTNIFDSLYNLANTIYGEEVGAWKIKNALFQGDDACQSGEGLTPESFEQVSSEMGLVASKDKQFQEDGYVHYLQKLHRAGELGGQYSIYRILASIVSYERFKFRPEDWNPALECVQTLSRLENGAFNLNFEDFVEFIAANDRYRLFRDLTPEQVIAKAGDMWTDVLAYVGADTINAQTAALKESAFARSATNRVLRGEELPPHGSRERFLDVYGARVETAEALLAA